MDLNVISNTKKEATAAIGIDLYNEFVAEDNSTSLTNGDPVIPNLEIYSLFSRYFSSFSSSFLAKLVISCVSLTFDQDH